jgi:hypothetical protein
MITLAGKILNEKRIPNNNLTSNPLIKRVWPHMLPNLSQGAHGHSVSPREMAHRASKTFVRNNQKKTSVERKMITTD